jgi:hypothetical protein
MNDHLSLQLIGVPLPKKNTIEKIKAEVNEDLLKSNKYVKDQYLGTNTLRRLLNDAFDCKWSWEILDYHEKDNYVLVRGRLHLPGLGFRDGFGSAKLDKKDNSAAYASAASYAFKNCVKQVGFAANLLDEDWEEDLYEDPDLNEDDDYEEEAPPKKQEPKKKPVIEDDDEDDDDEDEPEEKPAKKPAKKEAEDDPITNEQKEAMAELREIYKIKNNKQLLGFMQIWDKNLKSLGEITGAKLDAFLRYYDDNEDEFEDFDPEEVE